MRKILCILLLMFCSTLFGNENTIRVVDRPYKLTGDEDNFSMCPVWSPDGKKIAYTGSNYKGLWTVSTDGKEYNKISDEAGAGFGFKWSSNSKELLARVSKFENKRRYSAIKIFDINGNSESLITDFKTSFVSIPHWSPDETKVILAQKNGVELIDLERTASASLKKGIATDINLLLNGKMVKYDLKKSETVPRNPVPGAVYLNPSTSPDGSGIVFEVYGGNMHVMNTDGTGLIDLGKGYHPRWSPDGKWIVYAISEDDGHAFTSSDIYAIRADGTGKTNLTKTNDKLEMNPDWSPDGTRIAFDCMNEGSVYIMNVIAK